MSLRFRLVASIAAVLVLALFLGGMLLFWRATNSVEVELRAALGGAKGAVHQTLLQHGGNAAPADLAALVASFNGQRHMRTMLFDGRRLLARSQPASPAFAAPGWFTALIDVPVRTVIIPLTFSPSAEPRGSLVLQTDPANEIAEVWGQAADALAVMLLFCAATLTMITFIVGNSLRFLSRFTGALHAIADGRYETSMPETGPPEFAIVAQGFNRMVERLRGYQARNVALHEQILTLQEEERAEVARDLHDEVGPHLFAVNVDADAVLKLAEQGRTAEIPERAIAIRESVIHVQKFVKAILRQLRPSATLDFGLEVAVSELVSFWQRRNPEIVFEIRYGIGKLAVDRTVEDAAYRIVQESVSNAIRHGRPASVRVAIMPLRDSFISISVVDDGGGLRSAPVRAGTGVAGMAERARALKGSFAVAECSGGAGVEVKASLPCRSGREREMESVN